MNGRNISIIYKRSCTPNWRYFTHEICPLYSTHSLCVGKRDDPDQINLEFGACSAAHIDWVNLPNTPNILLQTSPRIFGFSQSCCQMRACSSRIFKRMFRFVNNMATPTNQLWGDACFTHTVIHYDSLHGFERNMNGHLSTRFWGHQQSLGHGHQ